MWHKYILIFDTDKKNSWSALLGGKVCVTFKASKTINGATEYCEATINFTIPESVMDAWQDDYADMRRFFIYGESLEFDELMQRIEELQKRVWLI